MTKLAKRDKKISTENSERNSGRTVGGRGNLRPFKPGQSGNPGGRPKLPPEFKAALKELTPDALELLGQVVRGALDTHPRCPNCNAVLIGLVVVTPQVIEAAKYLINREQGAPAQHATIKTEPEPIDCVINLVPWPPTIEQLKDRIRELEAGQPEGRKP
jgi:hypothetical protein